MRALTVKLADLPVDLYLVAPPFLARSSSTRLYSCGDDDADQKDLEHYDTSSFSTISSTISSLSR